MLLLGATGVTNAMPANVLEHKGPEPLKNPSKEAIMGNKIEIEVSWTVEGKEVRRKAEDLISNDGKVWTPAVGPWVYNGSVVARGLFFAELEGSIVSLITDPVALANNVAEGHENDRIWGANPAGLPPVGTPLVVTVKLQK